MSISESNGNRHKCSAGMGMELKPMGIGRKAESHSRTPLHFTHAAAAASYDARGL